MCGREPLHSIQGRIVIVKRIGGIDYGELSDSGNESRNSLYY